MWPSGYFEAIGNTEIGLYLFRSDFDPFLKIGVTLVIFHSSGKVSVSIQLLKIFVNDGPIMELANFRSLQGTPSNPMAFFSAVFF